MRAHFFLCACLDVASGRSFNSPQNSLHYSWIINKVSVWVGVRYDTATAKHKPGHEVSDFGRGSRKSAGHTAEGHCRKARPQSSGSKYRVTKEGVDWMIKGLREWQSYSDTVQKAIAGISVCAAVADCDIAEGQKVGLLMRDGLLFAADDSKAEARGVAVCNARKGEDVGVSNIVGIVPLDVGKVTILRLPGIQRGGSRQTDLSKLKKAIRGRQLVGAIGIEALIALRKVSVEPACSYGVIEAVVEGARSGLSPAVVCVDEDTSDLLKRLEEKNIDYEILDARKTKRV